MPFNIELKSRAHTNQTEFWRREKKWCVCACCAVISFFGWVWFVRSCLGFTAICLLICSRHSRLTQFSFFFFFFICWLSACTHNKYVIIFRLQCSFHCTRASVITQLVHIYFWLFFLFSWLFPFSNHRRALFQIERKKFEFDKSFIPNSRLFVLCACVCVCFSFIFIARSHFTSLIEIGCLLSNHTRNNTRISLSLFSVSSFYDWLANDFVARHRHIRIFSHWRLSCAVSAAVAPFIQKRIERERKTSKPKRRLIVNFQFKIELILCVLRHILQMREHLVYFVCRLAIPLWFGLSHSLYWAIDVYQYEALESHQCFVSDAIRNNLHYRKSELPSEMTEE